MENNKHTPKQIVSILLLFVTFSLWWGTDACAQRIEYIYDNAGNRETRQLQIIAQRMDSLENEKDKNREEMLESKVIIYPNPTRGILQIDILRVENFEDSRIFLYNSSGKQLQQWSDISRSNVINLSDYASGIYILQVTCNGDVSSWKIIKQ
ncbi:T9SS type A sorting domain-containing protein [Bacteroides sp.]|uniref:T9SS type A sorting domain-containing protein n=1 Tax=Bacteroides sp. TaxID=29523 RepID=UPI0025C5BFAE|nr:T9SS type A sorting domain-containing protein [Bacteroides sp.]